MTRRHSTTHMHTTQTQHYAHAQNADIALRTCTQRRYTQHSSMSVVYICVVCMCVVLCLRFVHVRSAMSALCACAQCYVCASSLRFLQISRIACLLCHPCIAPSDPRCRPSKKIFPPNFSRIPEDQFIYSGIRLLACTVRPQKNFPLSPYGSTAVL